MPNKRGEEQNKRGWEISENFNKRMCVCLCVCVCVCVGGGGVKINGGGNYTIRLDARVV